MEEIINKVVELVKETVSKDSMPEFIQKLTESLESELIMNERNVIIITNSFNNGSYMEIGKPKNKATKMEENLQLIAKELGANYQLCSPYHIRVITSDGNWNFYLSTERFHRDGEPATRKGIHNFINLMKKEIFDI